MHCIPEQDICFVQSKFFLCKIIKYNDFNFDDQAKNRYDKNIKQKLVKVLGDIKNCARYAQNNYIYSNSILSIINDNYISHIEGYLTGC